jgi:hypothetical protein
MQRALTEIECLGSGIWRGRPANTAAQAVLSAFVCSQGLQVACSDIGQLWHLSRMSSFVVGRVDPSTALVYRTTRDEHRAGSMSLHLSALQAGRRVWVADMLFRATATASQSTRRSSPGRLGSVRELPEVDRRLPTSRPGGGRPLVRPDGGTWLLPGLLFAASVGVCEISIRDPCADVSSATTHYVLSQDVWMADEFRPCTHADLKPHLPLPTNGRMLHMAELTGPDGAHLLTLHQECQEVATSPQPLL